MRLALLVAILIAGLCPGNGAEAAMSMDSDCPGGRCNEQITCHQSVTFQLPIGPLALSAATLPRAQPDLGLLPSALVEIARGAEDPPARWAAPLVSRSPPAC